MNKRLFTLVVALMAFLMGAQAQGNGVKVPKKASTPEAYVLFDEVEDDYFDGYYNGRLTFYYDTYRSSREGETFDLNEGYSTPDWHDKMRNVSKVVFNPSFADARPKSTFEWFSCFFDTDEGWEIYSTLYEIEGMEYLNTSQVETMSGMFYGCFVFKGADFSHFDTRNVVDMDYMFNYCNALTVLDLSSFDTSNVLEMVGMFEYCSKLSTIYVGDGWTVDHLDADATEDMFDYCESLVGGMGTSYDPEHVDGEYAHVDGGSDNPGYLTYSLGNVVSYHFKVGGVEVTNLNAHNIAGSSIKGKVSYDDATKTLTLDNVSITLLDDIVIRVDKSFEGEDFTINLVGENKLDNWGGYYDIQMLEKKGIFTGTGSLSGSICAGKGITIEGGCEINADKISGCASDYSPPLTISGAETKVYAEYGIVDIASLTLNDGLAIVQPEGARFNALKQCIVDADGNQAKGVLIKMPPKKYDLWVAGIQANEVNCADILGDGTVIYDDDTKTLKLNNATIGNDALESDRARKDGIGLWADIPGLKVVVSGRTNISSTHNTAVRFDSDATICGTGTLMETAPYCMFIAGAKLTVNGGVRLIANSTAYFGITGKLDPEPSSELVIEGANTEVRAYGPYGSIIRLKEFTLHDGLEIIEPAGAHFEGIHVYDGEGNIVQKQWVVISKPYEAYDLWVGGVRVNEHNRFDIDGNGKIKYDLNNKRLTVGCDIMTDGCPAIESRIDGLQIELKNDIALTAEGEGCAAIKATGSTTLRGSGSNNVTLTGTENAVSITSGTLSLSAMNLVATGRQALLGITGEKRCHLTITGATLDVTSADGEAAIAGFSEGIMLSSCEITEPAGGQIAGGQVEDASGNVASHVVISRVYNYSIFVNEQSVTQGNCDDILGDGQFSYDPETMTLHVKGSYETTRDHVIRNRTYGVTISVDADAELKSGDAAILLETATTLTGSHQLSLLSEKKGIELTTSSSLLIEDANLYVSGKYGLSGATGKESKLIIRNARVQVEATMRAIYEFHGGIELEDCEITLPEGGRVSNGEIVNSKGNTAKKVTIEPTGVATGMESLTPSPSPKGEGSWYTLGGQKLDAQPAKPGIYLHGSHKIVVR